MSILGILFVLFTVALTVLFWWLFFSGNESDFGCLPLILLVMWSIIIFKYWEFITSPLW